MADLHKPRRLKKELSLFSVYAIATGTTLSAGFFLLPGLAAAEAGPAVVLSYIIAAAFLVPAMLSIVELATAMPRAGGTYYFLDRSLGPLAGTVGGLGRHVHALRPQLGSRRVLPSNRSPAGPAQASDQHGDTDARNRGSRSGPRGQRAGAATRQGKGSPGKGINHWNRWSRAGCGTRGDRRSVAHSES